jgi:SNF2 family DNA or RNA helicase
MNPFLMRALGMIYAEEKHGLISLYSLGTNALRNDIMRSWSTSRIESAMFSEIGKSKITFPAFFAPDIHYILQTLQEKDRGARTNRRHLADAVKALEKQTWLSKITAPLTSKLNRAALSKFYKSPLPHQDEFFSVYDRYTQAYNLRGYLLSARAGSGKTLTNLMLCEMLGADKVIIVSPNNAVELVWAKTLREEYKQPEAYWMAGRNKPYSDERFLITHYEGLAETLQVAQRIHGKVAVISDEGHNLNDINSQRTQLYLQLCALVQAADVIWSSGTPLKALGYEVIPLLRSIDPLFTPEAEVRFRRIFGREASRALDILRNRMGMITYKVEGLAVENVVTDIEHKVKIPNGERYTLAAVSAEMRAFIEARLKYYKEHAKQFEVEYEEYLAIHARSLHTDTQQADFRRYQQAVAAIRRGYDPILHKTEVALCNTYELKQVVPSLPQNMRDGFKNVRSIIKYVELKVMGEALGGVLGRKRAEVHREMIAHAGLEQFINDAIAKTLIFTSYVSVVKDMSTYLQGLDFNPVLVYGETNKELTVMLKAFENRPELNPAIATYMSLSTAVPMTMASTAIFFNQPFRDHERIQARARLDRLGQPNPITFVTVLLDTGSEPNISTRALDIQEWSREQVMKIMGTDAEKLGSTLDTLAVSTESVEEVWGLDYASTQVQLDWESILEELEMEKEEA